MSFLRSAAQLVSVADPYLGAPSPARRARCQFSHVRSAGGRGHRRAWSTRRIRLPRAGAGRVGRARLFDHLVGTQQERLRDRETSRLGVCSCRAKAGWWRCRALVDCITNTCGGRR